jgi:hypothetical protein
MKYLLNVFIQHDKQELFTHSLATEIRDSIPVGNSIKYFFGEQTILITFETKLGFDKVKNLFDAILADLSITFILTPIKPDKMSYWFPKEYEKHLFGTDLCKTNDEYTEEDQKMVQDAMYMSMEDPIDDLKMERISTDIKKKIFGEPKIPTLDELLDKINLSGMSSLTADEKNLLTQYSK